MICVKVQKKLLLLLKKKKDISKYCLCQGSLQVNIIPSPYIGILSRGGLTEPRENIIEYDYSLFCILDITKELLLTIIILMAWHL